jgi:ribonuclease P protein component
VSGSRSFPRTVRLRRRREFLSVQRASARCQTSHFVVLRRRGETSQSRLGVTVSSQIGNAVVRNRIKRLVRETFRHLRSALLDPIDVVIIARRGADQVTHAQAADEIRTALVQGTARG